MAQIKKVKQSGSSLVVRVTGEFELGDEVVVKSAEEWYKILRSK